MANWCFGFGLLAFPTGFSTGLCENRRAAAQQLYETIYRSTSSLSFSHVFCNMLYSYETCDVQADIASPQAQAEVSQNPGTLVKPKNRWDSLMFIP